MEINCQGTFSLFWIVLLTVSPKANILDVESVTKLQQKKKKINESTLFSPKGQLIMLQDVQKSKTHHGTIQEGEGGRTGEELHVNTKIVSLCAEL